MIDKSINSLKPLFKQRLISLNEIDRKTNFRNRVEYWMAFSAIPKRKYQLFLDTADQIVERINNEFPLPPKPLDEYWSRYNFPDPLHQVTSEYPVPGSVYKVLKKKYLKLKRIIPKIRIIEAKSLFEIASYNRRTNTEKVYVSKKNTTIQNAVNFARGIGYARTFFELEVYTNPNQNFDKMYARAFNRCFPKANQKKNPFYVLDYYLLGRPGGSITVSVAYAELLLKNNNL